MGEQHLPDIDSNMIWPVLLDLLPAKSLQKALKDDSLPLTARVFFCTECLEEGNSSKVIQLLEDYYFANSHPDTGENAAYGLSLLFDAFDQQGMPDKKMALIDHICKSAPSSPMRSDALQRLETILA